MSKQGSGLRPISLAGCVGAGFTVYLAMSPLRLYLLNRAEFVLLPVATLGACLVLLVLLALMFRGLQAVLDRFDSDRYARVLLVLFTGVFVHDQWLFSLLPELDGVTQAVTDPALPFLDLAWLAALAWAVTSNRRLHRRWVIALVSFFIAMPALGLVHHAVTGPAQPRQQAAGEVDLPLSTGLNVIHILFDALQATELPPALERLPEPELFDGFTWYRNTVGASFKTDYSLPTIFSGRLYTDYDQFADYYRGAEPTLMDAVAEAGFDIRAGNWVANRVPPGMTGYKPAGLAGFGPSATRDFLLLLDTSLIRIAPFALKNSVLNNYEFRLAGLADRKRPLGNELDRRALLAFTAGLFIDPAQSRPVYHYLHLLYPHAPYTHRPDCSYAGQVFRPNREQAKQERHCAVRDFGELLRRLRTLDVYDQALIVFQSDTGESHLIRPESLQDSDLPRRVKGGSPFALLAVKAPGATGPLKVSDQPASMQDVTKTILGQLGIRAEFDGEDLFAAGDLGNRERIYWAAEQGSFGVVGDMYEPANWRRLPDTPQGEPPPAGPGDRFGFGLLDPGGLRLLGEGWDRPLTQGINATYPQSELNIPLADGDGHVTELVFDIQLLFGQARPVAVRVNEGAEQPVRLTPGDPDVPGHHRFRVELGGGQAASGLKIVIRAENPGAHAQGENRMRFNKTFFTFRLRALAVN